MAVVTTPYSYSDGNTLDTAGHNGNIASDTAGQGIMSEPNGGLDSTNLAPAFAIAPELVQTEQAVRSGIDQAAETLDFMSDAFSSELDSRWTPIAGCGLRFYLPYDVSVLLMQWSLFVSPYRIYLNDQPSLSPAVRIKMFFDGTALTHTSRMVPKTVLIDESGAAFNFVDFQFESHACTRYDMANMERNLTKGWHDVSVKLHMETFDVVATNGIRSINGTAMAVTPPHQINNRLTVGIRNVRYIAFGA